MHHIRSVLVAGVLAAVCGQAMAGPISLAFQLELAEEPRLPTERNGLLAVFEFPEAQEAVFTAAPEDVKANERVPEPPTGITLAVELFLVASFWALHGQMRKQGHRPFRRRVRSILQMMA